MNIQLIQCTIENLETLQTISRDTFYETFHEQNSEESMTTYLNTAFSAVKLTAELENKHSLFKLLYVNEELAGYLKVNIDEAQSEQLGPDALEVERIYILSRFQKLGLGKVLINEAIKLANEMNKNKIWLGVWEKNMNAIAFYEKAGFEKTGSHSFFMGEEEQIDFIMTKHL
ncbi:GNAT family N-acetyltransferase [Solibacillus isronensis]|uniref:GNAT family N-acetyltransferase n=1 Tax=Solibacillus isronensis TaxID=412383 RepID=UPI0009A7C5D8|nr:GNAT family N-acetyltransferase [Solibacillus isronensis]